ncbi:protein INVOLVED IN DE NOVO 2-like [Andrographis paniculata]|uniref:protein INVOLVED IN DE NOVO 2-like n=1 Tax=Andrographis paniculata TaxID=175694 RepID=UPI0021E81A3D|nr:protein INVOLVED IN DE NOVO 2-like [Andrographis paniculata]XP_051134089.1 protein INVOLVED IN DE NOVO 2-like [Andrographis paniculata]
MSYSSEDETDISESELEEYIDRCYDQLKKESHKVRFSDKLYRCPYCPGKKKLVHPYKDLLQHATDLGKGSQNKGIKHKGKHLGLVRFIKNDLEPEDLSSELEGLSLEHILESHNSKDMFVWPWMGILANVNDVGSSVRIKNDLTERGFNPVRVRLLPGGRYAVVEFMKNWSGFYDGIMFEREYEVDHHGKKEYIGAADSLGDGFYGWLARADDYKAEGILGEYLQKNGDLKSIEELEADEKRKTALLVADLSNTIQNLRMRVEELEGN